MQDINYNKLKYAETKKMAYVGIFNSIFITLMLLMFDTLDGVPANIGVSLGFFTVASAILFYTIITRIKTLQDIPYVTLASYCIIYANYFNVLNHIIILKDTMPSKSALYIGVLLVSMFPAVAVGITHKLRYALIALSPFLITPYTLIGLLEPMVVTIMIIISSNIVFALGFVESFYSKNYDQTIKLQSQLKEKSMRDVLTGLYNRTILNEICINDKLPKNKYGILMIDIDNFKKINDTYGHTTGDKVLKDVATAITDSIRSNDIAIRWGGEEMVVLVSNNNIDNIKQVANRIRTEIRSNIKLEEQAVTVSIGITKTNDNLSCISNIDKADQAMYYVKSRGKDNVGINSQDTIELCT